ncbi:hypothetical protein L5515_014616 [Caenorhabditis briggsae]|nr:hypothetical protein L3Y34_018497 [Caenorhabditis briggsae]UMM18652.1 hypothetical protein L5515_014616 [Caenorhabditis briggsae]
MNFGGAPPPLDDQYCASILTEAVWKQIEKKEIDYRKDLSGWRHKFEAEKDIVEEFAVRTEPRLRQWCENTDFTIRLLRSCNELALAQFYQDQLNEQAVYMQKVDHRRDILVAYIHQFTQWILEEESEKKKNKKKKEKIEGGEDEKEKLTEIEKEKESDKTTSTIELKL